jgi:hypothetical protein
VDCEDDNPISEYADGGHCDPPKGPIVRSHPATFYGPASPHPIAPERADGSLPFGQQEKQVNLDSRKLETRSDETDYFTSYYYVDGQYETVDLNNSRRRIGSEADTRRPHVLLPLRASDTINLVGTTAGTKVRISEENSNTARATTSSSRPAVKVAIPKIQSWLQRPNPGKIPGTRVTAVQTTNPNVQSSHVQSNPGRAAMPSGTLATSAQIATANNKTSDINLNMAEATQSPGLLATAGQTATSKVRSSHATAKATNPSDSPATAVQIANPNSQSSHMGPNTAKATKSTGLPATAVQIANPNTQSSHAHSNAILNKIQTAKSDNKTDQVRNSTKKKRKGFSRPKICSTEIVTEVTSLQETSDVPSIDMARQSQKQSSVVPKDGDKVKAPESAPEGRMDGTSELVPARSRNVQEGAASKVQPPDPPKTLSKAARKKQNKKRREVEQKERERQEAAEIEAAIASNREQMAAAETLLSISTTERQFRKLATDGTNAQDNGGESILSSAQ